MTYSHCESCGFTRAKQPWTIALTCPRCRARTGKTVMLVDSARFSGLAPGEALTARRPHAVVSERASLPLQ
jgi:hypothetical protein